MRIFRLVPASLLFLLLSTPVLVIPGQAYAWGCCKAGCTPAFCTCVGTWPCVYDPCASNTLQFNASPDTGSSQIDTARDAPAFTATKPDLTESLLEPTSGGKCFRDKLAFKLLGNAAADLKFEPIRFDEKVIQDRTLAFQVQGEEK